MSKKLEIGDIIVVSEYISPDDIKLPQHSFVVVENRRGKISGVEIELNIELKFDIVATVMSSIKNKKHKKKIESYYPKNMIIEFNDAEISNGNKKDGFIKANQLYYFQKKNISYKKIGKLNKNTLEKLLELILTNSKNGDITANYNNLKKEQLVKE